jgi:hypothetical protein
MILQNDNLSLLLAIGLLSAVLYLFVSDNSPIKNEGTINEKNNNDKDTEMDDEDEIDLDDDSEEEEDENTIDEEDDEDDNKKSKKKLSLAHSKKNKNVNDMGNLDKFFQTKGPATQEIDESENEELGGMDGEQYASFNSGKKSEKKKTKQFQPEKLLPKPGNDEQKDWFDQVHPTVVKNSTLIDVHRPIAQSTQSGTTRGSTWDLRGEPIIEKHDHISPWNQSTYQPNLYSSGLCGRPGMVSGVEKDGY